MALVLGYVIKEVIYRGRRSAVFRAIQEDSGKTVIIKTHRHEFPESLITNRLKREYELGKRTSHPNVIKFLSLESHGQGLAIIEEDIDALNLEQSFKDHTPGLRLFLHIAIQAAKGLSEIHNRGLMHKDLKPANIIFNTHTESLKIIDFGMASELSGEMEDITPVRNLEGTLAYISPEQTGRMNRPIDYRTDFYSLGVTLYHILCGKLPFSSDDPMELVHAQIARNPEPPSVWRENIPPVLDRILLKLMAKDPEKRFQRAHSLITDLERCYSAMEEGRIDIDFEPGHGDRGLEPKTPSHLYGRDHEVGQLLQTFSEIASGKTRVLMVAGYSGIGKSSLVREVHKPITARRGRFISGKFDQYQQNIPYSGLIEALRKLCGYLLSLPEEELKNHRARILEALEGNGVLLTFMIPELEQLIGAQNPIADLNDSESRNRFQRTLIRFLASFARKDSPLVLFLDDLQWIDTSMLELIRTMTTEISGYFLLIGAYRDNEVNESHPLSLTLKELEKKQLLSLNLKLGPLKKQHVTRLIADSFHTKEERVGEAAELLTHLSGGNPFLLNEMVKMLWRNKLVRYDEANDLWTWDMEAISGSGLGQNALDLILNRLHEQPDETQKALSFAACLGASIDLQTLATAMKMSRSETAAAVWPAIKTGLLLARNHIDFWFTRKRSEDWEQANKLDIQIAFYHDRIQQAVHEELEKGTIVQLHHEIGQNLLVWNDVPEDKKDLLVFTVAEQLNHASSLITEPEERLRLAALNLLAGKQAMSATAYKPASVFLRQGIQLLPENAWDEHYQLTHDLFQVCVRAEFALDVAGQAENLVSTLNQNVRSLNEKMELYTITISQAVFTFNWPRLLELMDQAMQEIGFGGLPSVEDKAERIGKEETELARNFDSLKNLAVETQACKDKPGSAEDNLLAIFTISCSGLYISGNAPMLRWTTARAINYSLETGILKHLPVFTAWRCTIATIDSEFSKVTEYARLSVTLGKIYPDASSAVSACAAACCFGHIHLFPFTEINERINANVRKCFELGQVVIGVAETVNRCYNLLMMGRPLKEILSECEHAIKLSQTRGFEGAVDCLILLQSFCHAVINPLSDSKMDKATLGASRWNRIIHSAVNSQMLMLRSIRDYWIKDTKEALISTAHAANEIRVLSGYYFVFEQDFIHVMLLIKDALENDGEPSYEIYEIVDRIKPCADNFAPNFACKSLLVQAELANLEKRDMAEVTRLYEDASASAGEWGFIYVEALANERYASWWIKHNYKSIGNGFLRKAHFLYKEWGADLIVQRLEKTWPQALASQRVDKSITPSPMTFTQNGSTQSEHGLPLDLFSVMKAAQAISGEIEETALLERVMRAMIENAGAQRGVLIIEEGDEAIILAENDLDNLEITKSRPVHNSGSLPESLLRYVLRTREIVVLPGHHRQENFIQDPYLINRRPASVLCMPFKHKNQVSGALYLENNDSSWVFDNRRIHVLDMLASQTAISLENARLVSSLTAEMTERRRAELAIRELNEQLEQRVIERTTQLEAAQRELIEKAHKAGMADIATSILHNTGNVINSLSTSTQLIADISRTNRSANLKRAAKALQESIDSSLPFDDPKWQGLVELMELLTSVVGAEFKEINTNAKRLLEKTDLLRQVIHSQEKYVTDQGYEERLPLNQLVHETLAINEGMLEREVIQVQVEDSPNIFVKAQPLKLIHVLSQLFKNAAEAMANYPIEHRKLHIRIFVKDNLGYTIIRDTGEGIPSQHLKTIFNQGYTTRPDQNGFGLHGCANAITEMKGSITADSEGPGKGASFEIRLPLAENVPV